MRNRNVCGSLLLVGLSACGGSGSDPAEPAFVVPARPASFTSESGLNQSPPDDWMQEVLGPRPLKRPARLTRDEAAAAETQALALARAHLDGRGFGAEAGVVVTHVLADEFGGLHVKMAQTHEGLPVLGAGLACHLVPDLPMGFSDNLVGGLLVGTRPAVTDTSVVTDALGRYPGPAGLTPVPTVRLAILPTLERVRVRSDFPEDNTDDFDLVLSQVRLVWEVVLEPPLPDVDAVLQARLTSAPTGTDSDDAATELARRENATRAGNAIEEAPFESLTTAILAPGMRYRYDAMTGALIDEASLSAQNDFQPEEGVGHSFAYGTVSLSVARWPANNTLYLLDIVRPDTGDGAIKTGNFVLDADNVATHDVDEMDFILDWNNTWGDGSVVNTEISPPNTARRQTPGVDVAFGIQMTWDFLDNVLSRWGPAGDGTPTRACVHWDDGYIDAHYNGSSKFICFGDGSNGTDSGNHGLQTVAHELGHAFWHAMGNGTDAAEAQALNEGHGDIQGGLVDLYRNTGLGVGSQVRRFSNFANWSGRVLNPDGYTEKDSEDVTHTGQKYWTAGLKDMPEHVGGLPFGRAFVYLAEGAPSDPADTLHTTQFPDGLGGIGIGKAALIWSTAIAYYIVGTPDYVAMRQAFLDASEYLYGASSMERKAVRRAFAAIRVGSSITDVQDPNIAYAQVFDVNVKDMTALVFAVPTDDTGVREIRVDGHMNNGVFPPAFALGYVDISRAPLGTSSFSITVEDSHGRTDSLNRSFLKSRDRNLIVNGDFEDGPTGWTTSSGDDPVSAGSSRAFIGQGYLTLEGFDSAWQQVTVPATAQNVALVFRLLVRNSTKPGDGLAVLVQNSVGGNLALLETYDHETPDDGRNWLNKGFMRQEFDLSAYAGQTIRIAFLNATDVDAYRFVVDQVVLTYEEDVTVGLPEVKLREWENTVQFKLPEITGLMHGEISRVDWYIDNVFVGAGPTAVTSHFGAYFLSSLTPGPHWVAGRVRGLDNAILKDTQAVWFAPTTHQELLVNGGFEAGAWDLTYSDPPPRVTVVANAPDATIAFDGLRALRMGGQVDGSITQAGQAVFMPHQMATLDFSIRVKVLSEENANDVVDELTLELWNLATFQKITELQVANQIDVYTLQGSREGWRGYIRRNVSIPPGLVNGKHVLFRLKTDENTQKPTTFFLDNASLRYTQWGLQLDD